MPISIKKKITIKESIINVKWKRVTAIDLDEKNVTIGKGQKYIAYAKVTPEDATYTDITWKSETPAVATIDKYGIIKGEAVRSNRNYCKS